MSKVHIICEYSSVGSVCLSSFGKLRTRSDDSAYFDTRGGKVEDGIIEGGPSFSVLCADISIGGCQ